MKAVFFDFDGTLTLTSLNFWKKMWLALGYDIKEGSYYKNLFHSAMSGKLTHQQWVDKCCAKFQDGGLTKDMLIDLAKTIDMIDGVEETMKELKKRGFRLFIVSGNVRQVIDENLGDLTNYFDGIYANDFVFNDDGSLNHIVGTKYDNEGKARLIKLMSEITESPISNFWFVGNGGNDEWVYTTGCKTLLINPYDTKQHDNTSVWHKQLKKVTNLTQILSVIND
ncbi:MAG: HAD-IB family phosphatase [Clostridia bacterium]|nr:HAD-IB family phosphatase [Clostridia bacterium]